MLVRLSTLSLALSVSRPTKSWVKLFRLPCVIITPLGLPVEPEVYMM